MNAQEAKKEVVNAQQKENTSPKKLVSPLRYFTTNLDKQVKKIETKKAQIAKLQKSLIEDEAEVQKLIKQISEIRG